jgi:hypothetical protein
MSIIKNKNSKLRNKSYIVGESLFAGYSENGHEMRYFCEFKNSGCIGCHFHKHKKSEGCHGHDDYCKDVILIKKKA